MMSDEFQAERVKMSSSCRDCDHLPKVQGAGDCFGEAQQYQRMHNGVIVRRGSCHGEWMTEIIRSLRGHHEPQEEKVFAEVLPYLSPGACMVELGSFWAYYSMWFQRAVPGAKSILVEPNVEKIEIGKGHFLLNQMQGAFVRGFAGRDSLPEATFVDWDGKTSRIPQIAVDVLMKDLAIDYVDILHSDIQGAEFEMLLGASQALSHRKIRYLFISTHGCEHRRCIRLLKRFGYQVIAEHSVLQSFSADGLIVVRSPDCSGPVSVEISRRRAGVLDRTHYAAACLKQRLFSFFNRTSAHR